MKVFRFRYKSRHPLYRLKDTTGHYKIATVCSCVSAFKISITPQKNLLTWYRYSCNIADRLPTYPPQAEMITDDGGLCKFRVISVRQMQYKPIIRTRRRKHEQKSQYGPRGDSVQNLSLSLYKWRHGYHRSNISAKNNFYLFWWC